MEDWAKSLPANVTGSVLDWQRQEDVMRGDLTPAIILERFVPLDNNLYIVDVGWLNLEWNKSWVVPMDTSLIKGKFSFLIFNFLCSVFHVWAFRFYAKPAQKLVFPFWKQGFRCGNPP